MSLQHIQIFFRLLGCILVIQCMQIAVARTQVVINEVSSKNANIIADLEGDFPDWIELYNAGPNAADLTGHFLSDDPEEPRKWMFGNAQIPAQGFLLVFASGKTDVTGGFHASFKVSSSGESLVLSDPNAVTLDRLDVPGLQRDHSYGRKADGAVATFVFTAPTPMTSNVTVGYSGYASEPEFDEQQSFFIAPITVTVPDIPDETTVHYTVDGSVPTAASPVYEGAFHLDTTTILRTLALAPGRLPSNIVTRTFFINEQSQLPVLSISSDPGSFWDPDTGIYVDGPNAAPEHPHWGANYWNDWERQIHLEMFLPNRQLAFSEDLGIRIHGGTQARTKSAKPMRLLAKQEFGASRINYRVFKEKPVESFDRLVLRNSGADFLKAHFRDGLLHRLMIKEGLNLDMLAYRPAVIYINGAYFGIFNMRERVDEAYIRENHPELGPEPLDILEEDFVVLEGDSNRMIQLWQFMTENDLSQAENFNTVKKGMDVISVADYFIAETYLNNTDWPNNNVKFWSPQTDTGKWRYLLFDLDVSLNSVSWVTPETNNLLRTLELAEAGAVHAKVLQSLLDNRGFRDYFINRYADLMNTTFHPNRFLREMDEVVAELRDEMPDHLQRWEGGSNPIKNWFTEIDETEDFIVQRLPLARSYVQDVFGLTNQVELQLNVSPPGAGKIRINTINPDNLPWNGVYYNGVPVTLTIEPGPGYHFKHWESLYTILSPNQQKSISYNFSIDDQITAFFEEDSPAMEVEVYPNPSAGNAQVRFVLDQIEDVEIGLYDRFGRSVSPVHSVKLNAGQQDLSLEGFFPATLSAGVYTVQVSTSASKGIAKLVLTGAQ